MCSPIPTQTHLHEQEEVRVLRLGGLTGALLDVVVTEIDTHFVCARQRWSSVLLLVQTIPPPHRYACPRILPGMTAHHHTTQSTITKTSKWCCALSIHASMNRQSQHLARVAIAPALTPPTAIGKEG
jgi:hypothetical protein